MAVEPAGPRPAGIDDGGGLGESGDHSHASAAAITGADVDGKNPRQQDSPRESLRHVMVTPTAVLGGPIGRLLLRHDLVAVAGAGGEDSVVADEIDPRRGHEGGEFLQQLMRRQDQVGRTVVPEGRKAEGSDVDEEVCSAEPCMVSG